MSTIIVECIVSIFSSHNHLWKCRLGVKNGVYPCRHRSLEKQMLRGWREGETFWQAIKSLQCFQINSPKCFHSPNVNIIWIYLSFSCFFMLWTACMHMCFKSTWLTCLLFTAVTLVLQLCKSAFSHTNHCVCALTILSPWYPQVFSW